MSIIVRKIGSRGYAYVAHRDGTRMVQSYIGPLTRSDVRRRVDVARLATTVPEHTMRLFATSDASGLRLQRDAASVITRVLEHGDLADTQWLSLVYPVSAIVDVVLSPVALSARARNFWLVWFEVPDAS